MEVTNEQQATEPVEAGPDFDALERQASAIEASIVEAEAPAPPTTNAADLLAALQMARMMVAPMFKWWDEFGTTWDDRTIEGIAQGAGAVMDKHGWSFGGLVNEFGPYIALGVAVVPPSMVTWQAIKAHKAEDKKQREAGS